VFERVDWSLRGDYMSRKHGVSTEVADEALGDPARVVINPDYNSTTGRGVRVIGYSLLADDIVTVIVLENDGTEYGVNGWLANEKDRRIYNQASDEEESQGDADEQED